MNGRHGLTALWVAVSVCVGSVASADGCFFKTSTENAADIYEPEQKAFIWYEDGKEDLVLQVAYEGEVTDFAWVVPVPARPEVDKVEGALFHELSELTDIQEEHGAEGEAEEEVGAMAPSVVVLERKQVGHYDVSVLAATEADALVNWLDENGYAQPEGAQEVLNHYVEQAWYYVAMRINTASEAVAEKLRSGIIAPLRLTFSAEHIVYPFRISALNPGGTEVLLYVAAAHAVRADDMAEEFCARVATHEIAPHETLAGFVSGDCVLTKLRGRFAQDQILDDMVLAERGGKVRSLAEVKNPRPPLRERLGEAGRVATWPASGGLRIVGRALDNAYLPPWVNMILCFVIIVLFGVALVAVGGALWRRRRGVEQEPKGDDTEEDRDAG